MEEKILEYLGTFTGPEKRPKLYDFVALILGDKKHTDREIDREIDKVLQRLRKAGKVRYVNSKNGNGTGCPGWELVRS